MNFVPYSEQQKEEARQTDMIDFLGKFEGFSFKKAENEFHCIEHNSLVVKKDQKRWYWNSQKVGGNTALDYLLKIHGKSYPEAMAHLVGSARAEPRASPKYQKAEPVAEKQQAFVLPESTPERYNRLFAYLNQSRNIDSTIISDLVKNKKIYQDKKNNAVFVGYDEQNQARFASVRGTNTEKQYRGDCTGSDKRYSFCMDGTDKSRLFIFESPIDAMSHATLFNTLTGNKNAWKTDSRLSLSGTTDVALEQYLTSHPNVKEIFFCQDNDEAGRTTAQEQSEKYAQKGYTTQICPPQTKDYNEDLTTYIKQTRAQQPQQSKQNIPPAASNLSGARTR